MFFVSILLVFFRTYIIYVIVPNSRPGDRVLQNDYQFVRVRASQDRNPIGKVLVLKRREIELRNKLVPLDLSGRPTI